jgi:hypothetical protein
MVLIIHGSTSILYNVSKSVLKMFFAFEAHTWSHSLHNARNNIRANWRFMQNLKVREVGISSSKLGGSVSWPPIFVDSSAEILMSHIRA